MIPDWTWYQITNALSGLLFVVLGLLVARVRGGGRPNRAFSIFAIAYGAAMIVWNLATVGALTLRSRSDFEAGALLAVAVLFLVAAYGIGDLGVSLASRSRPVEARVLAAAAGVAVVSSGGFLVAARLDTAVFSTAAASSLAYVTLYGAMIGTCVLFALQVARHPLEDHPSFATVSAASILAPAFVAATVFGIYMPGFFFGGGPVTMVLYLLGPPALVAALWLRAASRLPPPGTRRARNVAWAALGASLAGILASLAADARGDHWGFGFTRVVAVSLLAYAIVRGQLLGIDLKVRWTVKQSTLGAVFVATFFLASEGAQILFGGENEWVGLAAAGALVFALAPLQRAAESVAERAVPLAAAAAPGPADLRLAAYRRAFTLAWADGSCSPRELRMLLALREELRLTGDEVQALEREATEALGLSTSRGPP